MRRWGRAAALRRRMAIISATTETATDLVPAAFGTSYAVDRAILLGGQAVAQALGRSDKSGVPFFWSEKEMDHGDKVAVKFLRRAPGFLKTKTAQKLWKALQTWDSTVWWENVVKFER